mgnify:CR=1 FL=1
MKDSDFSEVFDAQVNAFDAALGMVKKENIRSFDYSNLSKEITEAMLFIEAVEMSIDEGSKGSGGTIWLKVKYQAHCVLSRAVKRTDIECLNFAAVVTKVVNKNRWGLDNVGIPEQISCFPGRYSNAPKGFDSWIVEWSQTVSISETWDLSRLAPENVFISQAPEIGRVHEQDYEELEDGFKNIKTP